MYNRINSFLTLIIVLIAFSGQCQSPGFFGKKNVVSINGLGSVPIIYSFLSNYWDDQNLYEEHNGKLRVGHDLFNGGFNAGIVHYKSNQFGYGFEFALNYSNCKGPNKGYYFDSNNNNTTTIIMAHERLNVSTMTFIPKIDFTIFNSILPAGSHHQLGIGYTNSKIATNDYLVESISSNQFEDIPNFNTNKIYNPNLKYQGITLLYGFNVRVPINERLLFNYGFRYTLNLTFGSNSDFDILELDDYTNFSNNYYVPDSEMRELVGRSRILSVIALNLGFNYVF